MVSNICKICCALLRKRKCWPDEWVGQFLRCMLNLQQDFQTESCPVWGVPSMVGHLRPHGMVSCGCKVILRLGKLCTATSCGKLKFGYLNSIRIWGFVCVCVVCFWFVLLFIFIVVSSCRFSHDIMTNLWEINLVHTQDSLWIRGNIAVQIKGRLPTNK